MKYLIRAIAVVVAIACFGAGAWRVTEGDLFNACLYTVFGVGFVFIIASSIKKGIL